MGSHGLALVCVAATVAGACVDSGEDEEVGGTSAPVAVTWMNAFGVSPSGDSLTKTDPTAAWNAGAASVETIAGDGYVELTTGEKTTGKMAGLSNGDSTRSYTDIDFAIHMRANGSLGVYEGGVLRGSFGTYVAGDLLRVEASGGTIRYKKNGVTFYTSAVAPTFPLLVDTSLYTTGATINSVNLVSTSLTWQNVVGLSIAQGDLTKTLPQTAWNAGASTIETLGGDGFVEFTAPATNKAVMAGLSSDDAGLSYTDIDFAVSLRPNGTVAIYEGGVQRGIFGSYLAGDVFRVSRGAGVVRYSRNGGLPFHTSASVPAPSLVVDTAFRDQGASIQDVKLLGSADACPVYTAGGMVCSGSFTVTNQFDVAEISGCAEITGNLTVQAPGMTVIALPALERVAGTLTVSANTDMVRLRLPELKEVGGLSIDLYGGPPTDVDLSRLRSGNSITVRTPTDQLNLPCLATAGSLSAVDGWFNPTALAIPRLQSVTGSLTGRFSAPALTTVGGGVTGELTAPVLTSIGGNVSATVLDAASLTTIGGTLSYVDGMSLPVLGKVGALTLQDVSTLDLPALVEVSGTLAGGGVTPSATCAVSAMTLPVLDLPALQTAGAIRLCWNTLTQVSLPLLQNLKGPQVEQDSLFIRSSAASAIDFPALVDVRGGVSLYVAASFPVLTRVTGRLNAFATIGAPVLGSVGGPVWIQAPLTTPALTQVGGGVRVWAPFSADALATIGGVLRMDSTGSPSLSLPALTSAAGVAAVKAHAMSSLDLPKLASVTGASSNHFAGEVRIHDTGLTALSLPLLTSTPDDFQVFANPVLTSLLAPSLTSVGSLLKISGNDVLPNCYATNLRDQLLTNGWTGTVDIAENNGTGPCP